MRNKTTATLLALCLGGIGGHKFYLGKSGEGILCVLFVWTFIPQIIAFFDTIALLCMSQEKFACLKRSLHVSREVCMSQEKFACLKRSLHVSREVCMSQEKFACLKRSLLKSIIQVYPQ